MNSITPILQALETSHAHFNQVLFGGSLNCCPTITLAPKGKRNALGWYAKDRWENESSRPAELNLSAEELKRPVEQVLETLIHEMCHQKAHQENIKDCSRNGAYHNERFKLIAEASGLLCLPKDKKNGYGHTELGAEGKSAIESIRSKVEPVLVLARRVIPASEKKPNKMLLWMCTFCETKIRSGRRDLSIQCNDCVNDFTLQE